MGYCSNIRCRHSDKWAHNKHAWKIQNSKHVPWVNCLVHVSSGTLIVSSAGVVSPGLLQPSLHLLASDWQIGAIPCRLSGFPSWQSNSRSNDLMNCNLPWLIIRLLPLISSASDTCLLHYERIWLPCWDDWASINKSVAAVTWVFFFPFQMQCDVICDRLMIPTEIFTLVLNNICRFHALEYTQFESLTHHKNL